MTVAMNGDAGPPDRLANFVVGDYAVVPFQSGARVIGRVTAHRGWAVRVRYRRHGRWHHDWFTRLEEPNAVELSAQLERP